MRRSYECVTGFPQKSEKERNRSNSWEDNSWKFSKNNEPSRHRFKTHIHHTHTHTTRHIRIKLLKVKEKKFKAVRKHHIDYLKKKTDSWLGKKQWETKDAF